MALHLLSVQTIRAAKAADKPYQLRDGGSLFLFVQPSGSKLWRYRFRFQGRSQMYAIGRYPEISLAQARQERDRVRKLVAQGLHPRGLRGVQVLVAPRTFAEQARLWIEDNAQWSSSYRRQIERYLEKDIIPVIGSLSVADVNATQIRSVVENITQRNARCAAQLARQWISQIFGHAVVHGVRDDNPAIFLKWLVRRLPVRHHASLGWDEIPTFMRRLDQWHGHVQIAIGLRLLALNFVRPTELRLALWEEFDLENRLWNIPKERMKMRRSHIVPISRQTVALLDKLRKNSNSPTRLFHAARNHNKELAASSFNRALYSIGYQGSFSAHGFRATATTLLGLLGYPDKLIDLQLAHSQRDKSRSPYDHTRFIMSRTILMQDWADILDSLSAGQSLKQITQHYGPLSQRRTKLLRVNERE